MMKTSIKEKVNGKVTLEVELEASDFQKAVNRAAKKLANKVNIPGFRKGKVPKIVLESFVGKEAICAEAVDDILPDTYVKAIEQESIEPIDQPEIDLVQFEEGKPFIFTAEIPVKPDVELGNYKDVEIEYTPRVVDEKDIENHLGVMQQRHAQIENAPDKTLEEGDTAVIDFEGFLNGEPFEGGKGENYSLVIGSKTFIPGFEEQLIGLKQGDEKEIKVTFPEEYQNEELKGKEATFKVKINEVKIKKLLPIDDEFAKDVSEFESLEELKQDIENKLKELADQDNKNKVKNYVLEKVSDICKVEVPDVLVERKIDDMVSDMEFHIGQQGISMENYLKFTNTTMEQLREQYKESAQKTVKLELVLEAIAKAENIDVSDEEIEQELEKISKQNNQPVDQIKNVLLMQGKMNTFKNSLIMDKTVDFLVDTAKVVEKENDTEKVAEGKNDTAKVVEKENTDVKKVNKEINKENEENQEQ
jgi:trigger factor